MDVFTMIAIWSVKVTSAFGDIPNQRLPSPVIMVVNSIQAARIEGVEGVVAEGAVEVHISGGVGEGVEAGPAAEGGGIVAETEVIQTARDIVSSTLMQIEPIVGAATGPNVPLRIQHRRLAERVVDVALDHVACVVKERRDIIVGILGDPQALFEVAAVVRVAIPQNQRIGTAAPIGRRESSSGQFRTLLDHSPSWSG